MVPEEQQAYESDAGFRGRMDSSRRQPVAQECRRLHDQNQLGRARGGAGPCFGAAG